MHASDTPQSARPRLFRPFALLTAALLACTLSAPMHGQSTDAASSATTRLSDRIQDRVLDRIDDANLTVIHGSMHPAVLRSRDLGRLSPTEPMSDLILVLKRSELQQIQLESLNAAQYDPASPEFHRWLTPQEFGAAYGLSQNDLDAVSNWLLNHGFTIQEIAPSHTEIRFSGNVAQVEAAFHTEMHSIDARGETHIANLSDIQIPAALASVVAGVKALHNFFPKAQHHAGPLLSRNTSGSWTPVSDAARFPRLQSSAGLAAHAPVSIEPANARSEFGVNSGGYLWELLVPYDVATIYNYKSLWTAASPINGAGQTIAIAGRSNIVLSDVATFRAATGLPASVPRVVITNSDPGSTALLDDRMENTLDVEWAGAAAPAASIVLVISSQSNQSTDPSYLSESYIINNNVAKIMSASYGECELGLGTAGNQAYLNLWQQAYTQGIAVFVSSGDSGSASCDDGYDGSSTDYAADFGLTVSGLASTPYNVAVGGTDLNWTNSNFSATNNSANLSNALGYIPEVPWNSTIANPIAVSILNNENGMSVTAETWANLLLQAYQSGDISLSQYDSLIAPVGGSGGVSACTTSSGGNPATCGGGYAKPSWQAGVSGISTSDKRTIPDISFFASNGFLGAAYLICDTLLPGSSSAGTPVTCNYATNALSEAVGGTSASSPIMAGIMALINQKAGSSQGNPNSVLYGLAARQNYGSCSAESTTNASTCYFNDIDSGNNETPCFAGSRNCTVQTGGDTLGILSGYAATAGYDKATGLGSLNVANVVKAWPSSNSATSPAVHLSTTSLAFASTNTGSSTAAQTVTLSNSGTAALSLSSLTLGGANASSFSQTNTCASSLAVSASCTVSVTFKPAAGGSLAASLSFADNAANSPQSVTLTGTGVAAPAVALSPTSLTFASTNTGSSSAAQTVTLTNSGAAALSISSLTLTGAAAASYSKTTTCGASLTAGTSCSVSVTFRPTAGGSLAASLSFADNATGSPQAVALTGTGVAASPAVTLSLTALSFPITTVNASGVVAYSPAQAVTLTNTGNAALTLSSVALGGTNPTSFTQLNNCPASLAAAASCTALVRFAPTASGSRSATLIFTDNAVSTTQSVALGGSGVSAPTLSLSSSTLSFGSVPHGTGSVAQALTLTNTSGTTPVNLTGIALSGTGAASFVQASTCGATLAASSNCLILVQFAPSTTGAAAATLTVTANNPSATATVALSGTGQ